MIKFAKISLWFIFIIGACGFIATIICNIISSFGVIAVSSYIEFPLGKPRYIDVDINDRIYCYSSFYNRLQIYDNTGRFIRGWFMPSNNFMYIDSNDETINVVTFDDEMLVYNIYGNRIKKAHMKKGYYRKYYLVYAKDVAYDSKNNLYQFYSVLFSTKIEKISPNGENTIVVSEPFFLWLLRMPFPVSFYLILPPLVWGIDEALHKRKLGKNREK